MGIHFQKELERIKKMILSLGALVEERVRMAAKAVDDRDAAMAEQIIKSDYEVDEREVDIEEECLKVLALHQPVAVDLRFIVAVIKINNDLERIGDEAVNIAHRVRILAKQEQPDYIHDYARMSEKVQLMLKLSLDALVNMDADLSFRVVTMDDDVDRIQYESYDLIKAAMKAKPTQMGYKINLYLISRHLERIADHATNIAEEVIYLIEGEIVRHGKY